MLGVYEHMPLQNSLSNILRNSQLVIVWLGTHLAHCEILYCDERDQRAVTI